MNNFQVRVLTSLAFGAVIISSVIFNAYLFSFVFSGIALFCLYEFYTLLIDDGKSPQVLPGLLTGAFLLLSALLLKLGIVSGEILYVNLLFFAAISIYELYRKKEKPFENIAYTVFGVLYVMIPFLSFCFLAFEVNNSYNLQLPLGFLFLLWANDSGAYLIGISIGKHRLFERISPKKSWEGFFGGVAITLLTAYVLSFYFEALSLPHWLAVALLISVFGTFGDLAESMFKRSINIKDSGSILPGHGGVLDRFDGLLIAAPVVYVYLKLFVF